MFNWIEINKSLTEALFKRKYGFAGMVIFWAITYKYYAFLTPETVTMCMAFVILCLCVDIWGAIE